MENAWKNQEAAQLVRTEKEWEGGLIISWVFYGQAYQGSGNSRKNKAEVSVF